MRKELRAVIDTNIIISAVIGKSTTLINIYNCFVDNLFTPIFSPHLQEEILDVIKRPHIRKYFRAKEINKFKKLIKADSILVIPSNKLSLCRDSSDNFILEAAVEAKADFIVTGDKDLLSLQKSFGIPIVNAFQFSKILNKLKK